MFTLATYKQETNFNMTRLKYSLFSTGKRPFYPTPLVTSSCNWTFLGDPGAVSQEDTKISRTKIGTGELDFGSDSSCSLESFRARPFDVETVDECFNDLITVQTFLLKKKRNKMRKKKNQHQPKNENVNKLPRKFNNFVRKSKWISEALLVDNSTSVLRVLINSRIHTIQTR